MSFQIQSHDKIASSSNPSLVSHNPSKTFVGLAAETRRLYAGKFHPCFFHHFLVYSL
jgi:hypothetical protein